MKQQLSQSASGRLVLQQSGSLLSAANASLTSASLRHGKSGSDAVKAREAAVLQQATTQAIVAARSILNSGGSQATALSTAKAAAQSILVPHMAKTESGASKLFLGKRRAKKQSDIIASMALLSITNGSNHGENQLLSPTHSLDTTLMPNFLAHQQQQQNQQNQQQPPMHLNGDILEPTSPMPLSPSRRTTSAATDPSAKNNNNIVLGVYKNGIPRDAAGISESVRQLTNRVPSNLPKGRPKDLAEAIPDHDPIYYSPAAARNMKKKKNKDDTSSNYYSFSHSEDEDDDDDDDSQNGSTVYDDTLDTVSTESMTFGNSIDGRRRKPFTIANIFMCGMADRCGSMNDDDNKSSSGANSTPTARNHRSTSPNPADEQQQQLGDNEHVSKILGRAPSGNGDYHQQLHHQQQQQQQHQYPNNNNGDITGDLLDRLRNSASVSPSRASTRKTASSGAAAAAKNKASMEQVVLRAISAVPSPTNKSNKLTQDRRSVSMHAQRTSKPTEFPGSRGSSWKKNARSVISDPGGGGGIVQLREEDDENIESTAVAPATSLVKSTTSNSLTRKARFRKWVKMRRDTQDD